MYVCNIIAKVDNHRTNCVYVCVCLFVCRIVANKYNQKDKTSEDAVVGGASKTIGHI